MTHIVHKVDELGSKFHRKDVAKAAWWFSLVTSRLHEDCVL